ncbi:MAG TPA: hypothetical protein VK147_02935 [Candidatus Didemnitutus sp.]|nr:hypothetical protein [Candidatus Didemnitutus sp.]
MKTTLSILAQTIMVIALMTVVGACSGDDTTNPPPPPAELTMALDPAPIYLGAGSTAIIKLKINNADKLVSWRAVITFDPAKINATSLKIREVSDNLLSRTGATIIESDKVIDQDNGTITISALGQSAGFTGVTGSGTVAQFTISSPTADPTSVLTLTTAEVYTHPVANPPVAKSPTKVSADVKKPS